MKAPFLYHGAKVRMIKDILPLLPADYNIYCEPFFGSGAVFFERQENKKQFEIINDLNNDVYNFFITLKNDGDELVRRVEANLYSQEFHKLTKKRGNLDTITRAEYFFYSTCTSFNNILDRSFKHSVIFQSDISSYNAKKYDLKNHLKRLDNVMILNMDAFDVIKKYDTANTFFYIDPPYPKTTQAHYKGFTVDNFIELVEILKNIKGRFLLSCYPMKGIEIPFEYKDFNFTTTLNAINDGKTKQRTERVYFNYEADRQQSLF